MEQECYLRDRKSGTQIPKGWNAEVRTFDVALGSESLKESGCRGLDHAVGLLASRPAPAVATGTSFLQPIPPQELLVAFSLFCLPQDLFTAPCPFAHRQLLLWLGLTPLPSKSWAASVSRGLLTMSLRLACAHV